MFEQHFGLKSSPFDGQAAGADVFVAGTAVFGTDDYAEAIENLRRAARAG